MDSLYLTLLVLFLLVIIPGIKRLRRMAAVRHILNRKKTERGEDGYEGIGTKIHW